MVSIIVPIRYRIDLTRACIDSIMAYTDDYELILVQEGEDKKITELLQSYKGIKYVQNKTPKGYAGALNTGLKVATGDYVCFINNDISVIPNWMDIMLKVFDNRDIGLVIPCLNGGTSEQSVDWSKTEASTLIDNPFSISGVCFLVKREVIDKIGEWDEKTFFFGGGDWDFSVRLLRAGFKIAIARKAFIYHYSGASAEEYMDRDINKLSNAIEKNIKLLENKHKIKFFDYKSIYN